MNQLGQTHLAGSASKAMRDLGMQNQAFSFPMFDAQAFWSLQLILNNVTLPSNVDMVKHTNEWTDR